MTDTGVKLLEWYVRGCVFPLQEQWDVPCGGHQRLQGSRGWGPPAPQLAVA